MFDCQKTVVAACADTVFSPAGPIPISGTDAGIVDYVEDFLRRLTPGKRILYLLCFFFIQWSPLFFGPRRARFTRLTPVERTRFLQDMQTSRLDLRQKAEQAMRFILTLGYFAYPRADECITRKPRKKEVT